MVIMKHKYTWLILSCFVYYQKIKTDPVISFYMHPFPDAEKTVRKLAKPGKIARHTIEGIVAYSPASGIFSIYGGYLQVSDVNGQIMFPRKHEKTQVYLVITNKITPITMFENTIHHWELVSGTPAMMYTIERKYDKDSEIFYWDTQQVELPENNEVPLTSIVIFAKPKYILVPIGITITNDNPNLLLPPLLVRKGVNIVSNAVYILNFRHLFGRLYLTYKKEATRYSAHVTE